MATVYTQQARNTHRTWFLMAVFLAIIIGLGYFISYYLGNPLILYIAIIVSVLMNIASYWWLLSRLFSRAAPKGFPRNK